MRVDGSSAMVEVGLFAYHMVDFFDILLKSEWSRITGTG